MTVPVMGVWIRQWKVYVPGAPNVTLLETGIGVALEPSSTPEFQKPLPWSVGVGVAIVPVGSLG